MALQFTDNTTYIHRLTNIVQGLTTWAVWWRPDKPIAIASLLAVIAKIDAGYAHDVGIYNDQSLANRIRVDVFNGADFTTAGKTVVPGTWYPLWYTYNGLTHSFYCSGLLVGIVAASVGAITFNELMLGNDGSSISNGTFKYFREWSGVVPTINLKAETNSRVAVLKNSLVTDTPLTEDLLDDSINHNDWIAVGTGFEFIDEDPIPAHTTVDDALDIGILPYNNNITVKLSNIDFIFDQWFKYTAQAPEIYIGGWFFGDLANYTPHTFVYSDAGITRYPPHAPTGGVNTRFQMPVTAGHTYYFQAQTFYTTIAAANLLIDFLTAPRESIKNESIFTNDDTQDYYSAIISGEANQDYHVLGFEPFVITNSETSGDSSTRNGNILITDDIATEVVLYDKNLEFLLDTGIVDDTGSAFIRSTPNGINFYVGIPSTGVSPSTIYKVSMDGAVLNSFLTTGFNDVLGGMCSSPDETILYLAGENVNLPIKRWDLINGVLLSDLVAGIAAYKIEDIMTLADGSILVMYVQTNTDLKVIQYNSSGTILHTYDFGNTNGGNIFRDGRPDSTFFWIRVHNISPSGTCNYIKTRVSDGVQIVNNRHVQFEDGSYSAAVTATPLTKFGPSLSCPSFLIFKIGGIYKLRPGKRNDTLWIDPVSKTSKQVAIPNPFVETAALGE